MTVEEALAGTEMDFREYFLPLTNMTAFKYLFRIIAYSDNDCPAFVANLRKARKKWAWMSRIIVQ